MALRSIGSFSTLWNLKDYGRKVVFTWYECIMQDLVGYARFRDTYVSMLMYAVILLRFFQISLCINAPFAMPIKVPPKHFRSKHGLTNLRHYPRYPVALPVPWTYMGHLVYSQAFRNTIALQPQR